MSKKKIHGFIILSSLMTFTLLSLSFSRAQQMKQPLTEFSAPDTPEPQGFCGYCHILTYPAIFEKSHKTWKEEKHNQVSCVDCHYPPKVATGVKDAAQLGRPGPKKDHIPVGPRAIFPTSNWVARRSRPYPQSSMTAARPRLATASRMTHSRPKSSSLPRR